VSTALFARTTARARRAAPSGPSFAQKAPSTQGVCLSRPDGSAETCTVISTAPGAACVPGANFGCRRDDETCNATTSLCTKRAALGAACATDGDCVGYGYCDTAAGTCTARPGLGQPCDNTTHVWCLGSLTCANGTCVEPTPGVACMP